MLIENDLMGIHISQSIAGVGININQKEFHSSAPNPISIIQITHRESDRMEILAQVLQRIKNTIRSYRKEILNLSPIVIRQLSSAKKAYTFIKIQKEHLMPEL